MTPYTNYTNIDAAFCRTYEPGDRLVRGYSGEVEGAPHWEWMAELLFGRHNRDDRPDGQLCPSMSIGDVIVLGEVALSVDHAGFKRVDVDPNDLITDRTWVEMVR